MSNQNGFSLGHFVSALDDDERGVISAHLDALDPLTEQDWALGWAWDHVQAEKQMPVVHGTRVFTPSEWRTRRRFTRTRQ